MPATFVSVVLGQPEIASMVFGYQFGSYEDVRAAFHACNELAALVVVGGTQCVYVCDPSFRPTFASNAIWSRDLGYIHPLYHALENGPDARLPLHLAIREGFVQLTKNILACRPDLASDDGIALAFQYNQLEIAELLLDQRENVPERHQRDVVHANTPERRYIYADFWREVLARDDSKGLFLLQRFGMHPDDLMPSSRRYGIERATLENLTLALDLFPWIVYPSLLDDVADRGFLPLVRSLHERALECSTDAMDKAVMNGHLEVVRFLHEHRREGCTTKAMDGAATNGHLEVVQFLHFNRTEGCTTKALDGAIVQGHLDVVRFLLEHRSEGASFNILDKAAANGHLEIVQYLHSLGSVACTVAAVDLAAWCGHLEIVQFLLTHRSEGGSRDYVVQDALQNGYLRTVEYLLSRGYPFEIADEIKLDYSCFANPNSVGVFELLVAHGRPIEKDWMLTACSAGNLPLVRFLCAHVDTAWRAEALESAISVNAWDIVRLFLANDATVVSASAFTEVLRAGNLAMAAEILQRQPELRHEKLLEATIDCHNTKAARFLLGLGIGNPRECLLQIAGRPHHGTESKVMLPHCMDATDHLDNLVFLLDLLALPDRRRKTTLQLITQELMDQGRKASQTIQLPTNVAARASTLLEAGDVVDWALALVICHLHTTDGTTTTEELAKKTALVQDADLKMQLQRLLEEKA